MQDVVIFVEFPLIHFMLNYVIQNRKERQFPYELFFGFFYFTQDRAHFGVINNYLLP